MTIGKITPIKQAASMPSAHKGATTMAGSLDFLQDLFDGAQASPDVRKRRLDGRKRSRIPGFGGHRLFRDLAVGFITCEANLRLLDGREVPHAEDEQDGPEWETEGQKIQIFGHEDSSTSQVWW